MIDNRLIENDYTEETKLFDNGRIIKLDNIARLSYRWGP